MEQPQQRRTLFEPEPSTVLQPAPAQPTPDKDGAAQPTVERELPPPADVADPAEPERARFNPWLALLWVLGFVPLIVGLMANWQIYDQAAAMNAGLGENYYVLVSIVQTFAPWLVGVGLAAIVCAVLLHALDWRRRHP